MTAKFEVTLKDLRAAGACFSGYNKVVRALQGREFTGDDSERESYIKFAHADPIALTAILQSNGLDDALWALHCVPGVDRDARLFAVWCARQVEHLMTDQRSKDALGVAERFANGEATEEEQAAAEAVAWAVAWDAARAAAEAVAWAVAWAVARDAARAVAEAAAEAAAGAAARDAAWVAARAAQKEMFTAMCEGRAPWQQAD